MAWIRLKTASSERKNCAVAKQGTSSFGSLFASFFTPKVEKSNKQALENAVKAHPSDINTNHHPYAFIRSAITASTAPTNATAAAATTTTIANTTPAIIYLISLANVDDDHDEKTEAKEVRLPDQMMNWLGWGDGMEVELLPLPDNDSNLLSIGTALIEVDLDSYVGRCDFTLTADELSRRVRAEFAGLAINTSQMLLYALRDGKDEVDGSSKVGQGLLHSLISSPAAPKAPTLLTLDVLQLYSRSPSNPAQLIETYCGLLRDDTHITFTLAEGTRLKMSGASSSHATKLTTPSSSSKDGQAGPSSGPVKKPIQLELMTDAEISTAGLYHLYADSTAGLSSRPSKKGGVQQFRVVLNAEDYDTVLNGKNVILTGGSGSSGDSGGAQQSAQSDGENDESASAPVVYAAAGNYNRVPKGKIALHDDIIQKIFGASYDDDEVLGSNSPLTVQLSLHKCKEGEMVISEVRLEIGDKNQAVTGSVTYINVDSAKKSFLDRNKGLFFNVGEELVITYPDEFVKHSNAYRSIDSAHYGGGSSQRSVKARVTGLKLASSKERKTDASCGVLKSTSQVTFTAAKGADVELYGKDQEEVQLFDDIWDFQSMGIGGLDTAFADIFRRAFASRLCPRQVVEKLGLNHVRGLLLHGPPGTGKTLIARKLAERLRSRPPKIVNGPEVFSMWVGQSEEHVRKLFEDAEREYQAVGDKSRLHVIIFDEFDAIAPNRASEGAGAGSRVNQKVVNQLLSKMDGVNQLNNILVIGMTNQKDLIDPAMLRPGRMEIQLEISLPDDPGRLQILQIHTERMRGNDMLDAEVDLQRVARRAVNFSGAELEGLVRAAQSLALERLMKMGKDGAETAESFKLTMEDFDHALKKDVKPAFGSSIEDLQLALPHGIIHWHDDIQCILDNGTKLAQQCRSGASGFARLLLVGERRAGTTALAAQIAIASQMAFIRMVTPHSLCSRDKSGGRRESVATTLQAVFDDAYKSPEACVILDAFESLVSLSPGSQHWDVEMSQKIQLLLEKRPPENKKLFIIITSSCDAFVKQVELRSSFDVVCTVPSLTDKSHVIQVFDGSHMLTPEEVEEFRSLVYLPPNFSLGVKKLLELVDSASQAPEGERVKALAKLVEESQAERRMDLRYLNFYA